MFSKILRSHLQLVPHPAVWHFTSDGSLPLTVVTVFGQNLSKAGGKALERASEGNKDTVSFGADRV